MPDSIRLHIPRTLKLIYDIRNKRDAAHLGDDIDPNLQDATLVVGSMDWVLAELVRLYHDLAADDAQKIIENVVTKEVPAVQEIAGHPVILKNLQAREQALLLLYRAGAQGATLDELAAWLRTSRKDHLKDRLLKLDEQKLVLAHPTDDRYYLTASGDRMVESPGGRSRPNVPKPQDVVSLREDEQVNAPDQSSGLGAGGAARPLVAP